MFIVYCLRNRERKEVIRFPPYIQPKTVVKVQAQKKNENLRIFCKVLADFLRIVLLTSTAVSIITLP